jgi:hypothetical protein
MACQIQKNSNRFYYPCLTTDGLQYPCDWWAMDANGWVSGSGSNDFNAVGNKAVLVDTGETKGDFVVCISAMSGPDYRFELPVFRLE